MRGWMWPSEKLQAAPAFDANGEARRKTKIVATLGPASDSPEVLRELMLAGVNVCRLNLSHGTHEEHAQRIELVRKLAAELALPVGILADLQGPKIRTGTLASGPVELRRGARFTITTRPVDGDADRVSTTYPDLPGDVTAGSRILVDDGNLELRVLETSEFDVTTEVVHGGVLKSSKGINLPGVDVSARSLTEKDTEDVAFAVKHGADFIALSFVRKPGDVRDLKRLIRQLGADIPVVAKIEKPEAVDNLEGILSLTDVVMLARGDLGVEVPTERVPVLQKQILARANAHGVPVITATQMLESMIHNPRPTRAESTDVANAVFDGTDALMLSGETAAGAFPVRAVQTMARIALEAERHSHIYHDPERLLTSKTSYSEAISRAALAAARELGVRRIVVYTYSGASASLLAQLRPPADIIAFTPYQSTLQRLSLCWGVIPQLLEIEESTDALLYNGEMALLERGLATQGETIVIVAGSTTIQGATNLMKIRKVGG
jgi:pyruvate kinase